MCRSVLCVGLYCVCNIAHLWIIIQSLAGDATEEPQRLQEGD